jgi:hypothetical protein
MFVAYSIGSTSYKKILNASSEELKALCFLTSVQKEESLRLVEQANLLVS